MDANICFSEQTKSKLFYYPIINPLNVIESYTYLNKSGQLFSVIKHMIHSFL